MICRYFLLYQKGETQPLVEDATKLGKDLTAEGGDLNENMVEIILNIPGIDFRNYGKVMYRIKNLRELCVKSLADCQELIGVENGKKMFNFFNMMFTGATKDY